MKIAIVALCMLALVAASQAAPVTKPEADLCPICLQLMNEALDQLVNIILNVGVVGSCGDVCGKLPAKLEQVACDLVCDYVGITEFVKILQEVDPDAVYICQVLGGICPIHDNAKVDDVKLIVAPSSGQQGSTFSMHFSFNVVNATGAGEVALGIQPPNGEGFGDGQLVPGFPVGPIAISFRLQAKPSEQEPFSPGTYQVEAAVCNGECGATHPHTATLGTASASFVITQ
ncbi:countin-2 [Thecamonas trahens ATCC 50062]|uniref:Countin-2 n=1 Tax=Thecamonas trahens ATCC 50062 TaxID=461836 RepID=A0A0L0D4P4_THETB|nr:countin-2 [Thecamonas trahens ATCC 50062]KNC47332.1 countin-2 [Thecamonas trahens ATCC 50062]|eukprot:XP_013759670.1 countin-2 [Thecamonas trahens ATCC 50062]